MLISNCCYEPDRDLGKDGPAYTDIEMCPECKEHCEWVDSEKEDEDE